MIRIMLLLPLFLLPVPAHAGQTSEFSAVNPNHFKIDGFSFIDREWKYSYTIPQKGDVPRNVVDVAPVMLDQKIPQIVSPQNVPARAFNKAIMASISNGWGSSIRAGQTARSKRDYRDVLLNFRINEAALPGVISFIFDWRFNDHHDPKGGPDVPVFLESVS